MRKTFLSALVASAFTFAGAAHAGLLIDLNGAAPGGQINADSLDWAPTSFLARNGNGAISSFITNSACPVASACQFEVLTHAKLTGYTPSGGSPIGIPAGFGEITMVARYTEKVVAAAGGAFPSATFASTGAGYVEFYFSAAEDSNGLTGANFSNGRLIGRLDGVDIGAIGTFTVTNATPQLLDQAAGGDQYAGQQTVRGTGSQDNLKAGTTGVALDSTFFLTTLAGFSLIYDNISIGLPYNSTHPSDCYNDAGRGAASVGLSFATQCLDNHNSAAQMDLQPNDGGYAPRIGAVNGLGLGANDFVAQTDYNSAVTGVPEPGSLALVGLALGSMGFMARRRRRG